MGGPDFEGFLLASLSEVFLIEKFQEKTFEKKPLKIQNSFLKTKTQKKKKESQNGSDAWYININTFSTHRVKTGTGRNYCLVKWRV